MPVHARATRFSADLATCIASPGLRLSVAGRCVGLGKSALQIFFVVSAKVALAFAMQVQEVAEIFFEVVDGVDGQLDAEVRRVGVRDWNLQRGLAAAGKLAQECLAIEKPGVGQVLRLGTRPAWAVAVHSLGV